MNTNFLCVNIHRQRGFSMVELMVSLTLGLFLIAGVVQLFAGSKSTNNTLNAVSDIQQNGRIAIERLKTGLRMAGHMGCSNLGVSEPAVIATTLPYTFDLESVVQGSNNAASGNTDNAKAGTDVLTVISATGADADLKINMTGVFSNIKLTSNPSNIQAGDVLVISDCENFDIFTATVVTNNTNNTVIKHQKNDANSVKVNKNGKLSKVYRDNALVLRVGQVTYAVQDTGRTDKAGNAIFSLFETRGGVATEVVSGVDDMQLSYGVDTGVDGAADVYRTANQISGVQWGSVVSVRISLVISTEGDSGGDVHPYRLNGAIITPTDDRIRKVFTTTVSLRNRIS